MLNDDVSGIDFGNTFINNTVSTFPSTALNENNTIQFDYPADLRTIQVHLQDKAGNYTDIEVTLP